MQLAELHRQRVVGELVEAELARTREVDWIIEGAGFVRARAHRGKQRLRRLHSLPDRVGPGMQVLVVGLNPSPASADSGVGFHKAGNRFWPAVLAAGLASVDRDPDHAFVHCGMGMTDIVKRTTRRADEVSADEFRAGMARIEWVCEWLAPASVLMVGLQGWRTAVDRKAERGWQDRTCGGRPVYVMPSTSGLNAHDTVATLTGHVRAAIEPDHSSRGCGDGSGR